MQYNPNFTQQANVVPAGKPVAGAWGGGTAVEAKYIHDEEDIGVRNAFVRKVYIILSVQLLFTGLFMVPFVVIEEVKLYVQQNAGIYYAGLGLALVGLIAIGCFESVSRTYPANYFFSFLATLGYSVLLGVNASRFDVDEILIAVGITLAIVVCCTLFACQTKIDFTTKYTYLLAGFVALVVAGIFAFIYQSRAGFMMLSGFGAFLFACFLIYDTQIILGGAHNKYVLDVDEYVFAALNIYIDVVIIFQCLLGIVSAGE